MPKQHAYLSASGAHRWMHCPGSARLEALFPSAESEYAREGTIAHELAELETKFAIGQITPAAFKKQHEIFVQKYSEYSQEMQDAALTYARFIGDLYLAKEKEAPIALLEQKVDFSGYVPEGFGTSDCLIVTDSTLYVIDFKYGKGVPVSAESNPQLRLYALGAIKLTEGLADYKDVQMIIIQPRISTAPSEESRTVKQLKEWAKKEVVPAAKLALSENSPFDPSEEACRFCKAKEECKARAEKNLQLFIDNEETALLNAEQAGEILEKANDIEAWLSDLKNMVMSKLLNGQPVLGWKLVEGRSVRQISDLDSAAERLIKSGVEEPLLYERKLITLTQMEKSFGKSYVNDVIGDLIIKPKGKPTLAPSYDRRPEYTPEKAVLDAFEED